MLNSSQFLHFYYSGNRQKTSSDLTPIMVQPLNESYVRLTYNNNPTSIVSGTLNQNEGLLSFSLNNSQLVNRMVRLKWEQNVNANHRDCAVWSLDNVVVTLHHNNCTINVFSDDFEDRK